MINKGYIYIFIKAYFKILSSLTFDRQMETYLSSTRLERRI